MFYLEKVDESVHKQIQYEIFHLVKNADWAQRYRMCNVWNTQNFMIQNAPILKEVIKTKFEELYDYKVAVNPEIWINRYPYGSFQERHQHREYPGYNRKVIVFNYFLVIPENSGSFVADNVVIGDDKEGYVAFFDGMMYHEVTPNNSQEVRYTVSGNIIVQDTL
jgi:hypothetical protein